MIYMARDTRDVIGKNAEHCDSRSLFLDRFARPDAKDSGNDTPRRQWFEDLRKKPVVAEAAGWRAESLRRIAGKEGALLYAQLQSRLMVNMSGGVMENAELCIDRFGLPYIPGSAVKGCTRRMAIQELVELRESGQSAEELAKKLVEIALVFGWGDTEWQDDRRNGRNGRNGKKGELRSDFEFACGEGEQWKAVRDIASRSLFDRFRTLKYSNPDQPWKDLPNFAGAVAFLSAHTGQTGIAGEPELGNLELDVVTCHHGDYYSQKKDAHGKLVMPVALDTEDPVPVVFPAVAPGHVFMFMLVPLRNCPPDRLATAKTWLKNGIETFGIGAKTAAGYGWFNASEQIDAEISRAIEEQERRAAQRRSEESRLRLEKERQEAETRKRQEMKAALASLSPEQQEDYKIAQLTPDQFRSALDNFMSKIPEEQKAMIRAMRLDSAAQASRRADWDALKIKSQRKGGKFGQIEQAIRVLSKQMFPGKEGKMP